MAKSIRCNPFKTEDHLCVKCKIRYQFAEVSRRWKCLACDGDLASKVTLPDGLSYCCSFIHPYMLKEGDTVTIDGIYSYKVIRISDMGNRYRVALKDYNEIMLSQQDWIAVIQGVWLYGPIVELTR